MDRGFTLIELSIVLVIIGLITSGIVGGRSLIYAAEIRSVISDVDRFRIAIATFEMQYSSLPGDIPNAQEYWPGCVDNVANTCNGNGNGLINHDLGFYEHTRTWEHLSLAGLIPGEYKGDGIDPDADIRPISKLSDESYYEIVQYDTGIVAKITQFGKQGIFIWLRKFAVPSASISPRDASVIDTKMDDGIPNKGFVNGRKYSLGIPGICVNGGQYIKDRDDLECIMAFWYMVTS